MQAALGLSRVIDRLSEAIGKSVMWLILVAILISAANAVVRKLFMLLHGRYGTAFTSKFATGKLDAAGSDRGTLSAMLVWQSDLRRYADDVVQEAAQRCKDANPTFPPSLPEFEALCKACMPRETYAQQQGWKPLPRKAMVRRYPASRRRLPT